MTRLLALVLFLSFASFPARVLAADGPSPDVPELKALSHYVGTWDVRITTGHAGAAKGTAKAEWVLGGRFVRQMGVLKSEDGSPDTEIVTLLTFDENKKAYRTWTFLSNGAHVEADATWDEASKTMTSVTRDEGNGIVTTTKADFSRPGVERWTITAKNRDGMIVGELRGENTKRDQ